MVGDVAAGWKVAFWKEREKMLALLELINIQPTTTVIQDDVRCHELCFYSSLKILLKLQLPQKKVNAITVSTSGWSKPWIMERDQSAPTIPTLGTLLQTRSCWHGTTLTPGSTSSCGNMDFRSAAGFWRRACQSWWCSPQTEIIRHLESQSDWNSCQMMMVILLNPFPFI